MSFPNCILFPPAGQLFPGGSTAVLKLILIPASPCVPLQTYFVNSVLISESSKILFPLMSVPNCILFPPAGQLFPGGSTVVLKETDFPIGPTGPELPEAENKAYGTLINWFTPTIE